jgi:hypothetical protein
MRKESWLPLKTAAGLKLIPSSGLKNGIDLWKDGKMQLKD